ncbi:DEAD/DEAH box helicase family protein [Carboxylicivirga sp. M1479]|uniref:DEAD/DEAH box helicase family protein n=1 Tax=Carboxylicivirga sp. M1479 TaxID=2594476 RepID=UPI0011787227|nr:DEAD/DEAH box helicase family protein [Carboxylicivirga sp. M1479]TRX71521.1 hypothetical protein FNN09_06000 [Carboxylicivirga sp. M1479]
MNIYDEALLRIRNNDKEAITELRNSNPIYIFRDHEYNTAYRVLKGENSYHQLKEAIIEENTPKDERKCFLFNRVYDKKRLLTHCRYPHTVIVDIDGKNQTMMDALTNDMNVSTHSEALEKLNNIFKNDEHCLLTSYSASGKGLKAVFQVINELWLRTINHHPQIKNWLEKDIKTPTEFKAYHEDLVSTWQEHNYNRVLEHLSQYNVQYHKELGVENNYLDKVASIPVQVMYSVNSKGFHINKDAYLLTSDLKDFEEVKELAKKRNKAILKGEKSSHDKSINNEQIVKINQFYVDNLTHYLKGLSKKEAGKLINNETLKTYCEHGQSSYPIRLAAKHLNNKGRRFIYAIFKKHYKGDRFANLTIDFETFNHHLNTSITGKYIELLYNKININIPLLNTSNNSDLFGNNYNTQLSFNIYVSERKSELFKIFDDNKNVILKAKAGGGKTTLIQKYIDNCFSNGYKRIAFVIPKNSLNHQQKEIITEQIINEDFTNDFKLVENFGNGNYFKNEDYGEDENVLILSSTPKLQNITKYCDLIIVDELQNLVAYANEIKSNLKGYDGKLLLMTATPEPYLIGLKMDEYHYVNLIKSNDEKKNIMVHLSLNHNKLLDRLIDKDKKQMIFYNDFDEHTKIQTRNKGIEFFSLSSQEKEKYHCYNVIESQLLDNNRKYISTSYISDGINFQNEEWDDLIIMDNGTVSIFEIYQLSERFRKVENLNIYYIATPRIFGHYQPILFSEMTNHNSFNEIVTQLQIEENELNRLNKIGIELVDNKYMINDGNEYILNKDAIKLDLLTQYFNSIYQTNQQGFKELIEYYFEAEFNYNDLKEKISSQKVINQSIDIYKKYHNELTMIYDEISIKQKISIKDIVILNEHQDRIRKYNNRKKEVESIEIEITDDVLNKITLNKSNYTNWFNRKKCEMLGSNMNGDNLNSASFLEWEQQNTMKDIIVNSPFLKDYERGKTSYQYVDLDDLVDFIKRSNEVYEKFKTQMNYHFELNATSLNKYIRNIKRHFITKRVGREKRNIVIIKNPDN